MKIKDSCPTYDMRVVSITMSQDDLDRIDDLSALFGFKNRSACVRACLLLVDENRTLIEDVNG